MSYQSVDLLKTDLLETPYRGLIPYSEEDAPFFFGREKERNIIIANLRGSPLTVLYGSSGVGKSSVLRAGVFYYLQQEAKQNLKDFGTPEFAVVVFNSWHDDPLNGLMQKIEKDIQTIFPEQEIAKLESSCDLDLEVVRFPSFLLARKDLYQLIAPLISSFISLLFIDFLQTAAKLTGDKDTNGRLFVILDQFEEYFLYHSNEEGEGTFFDEFPRLVNRPDVNFLISIREDSLAQLDRFKPSIPSLFDNYLRLKHIDSKSAYEAIVKPIDKYNELVHSKQPITIEEDLAEVVIDQVSQVFRGEKALGGLEKPRSQMEKQIETSYLQLVMTRIWEKEIDQGSHRLQLETLNQLGKAEEIVKSHLKSRMDQLTVKEQDVSAEIFNYLVTPSGTKIGHTVSDLSRYINEGKSSQDKIELNQVENLLQKLSEKNSRILHRIAPSPRDPNAGERYEIFHDVLASAILDWRRQHQQERELYTLKGELRGLEIKIWQSIAKILSEKEQKVSDITRFEMRRELNSYHIPKLYLDEDKNQRLKVEDTKNILTKLGLYKEHRNHPILVNILYKLTRILGFQSIIKNVLGKNGMLPEHNEFNNKINRQLVSSIVKFQEQEGLKLIDGIIGPETLKAMKARVKELG